VLEILKHDKTWGGQFALVSPTTNSGVSSPIPPWFTPDRPWWWADRWVWQLDWGCQPQTGVNPKLTGSPSCPTDLKTTTKWHNGPQRSWIRLQRTPLCRIQLPCGPMWSFSGSLKLLFIPFWLRLWLGSVAQTPDNLKNHGFGSLHRSPG